jgi:hypothetical protein
MEQPSRENNWIGLLLGLAGLFGGGLGLRDGDFLLSRGTIVVTGWPATIANIALLLFGAFCLFGFFYALLKPSASKEKGPK